MERIDPWANTQITNYEHVFKEFGLKRFDSKEFPIKNYLFERGIVIAHRDFEHVYERMKQKKPFINMTGIATSGSLHFGNKLIVDIYNFFKHAGGRSYFCIADIEGYVSKPDSQVGTMENSKELAVDILADVLALGVEKDDCYLQSNMDPKYYELTFVLSKKITENTFRAIYGHQDLGKTSAAILQLADILHPQLKDYEGPMPSITAVGLDQDPHLRLTRDVAQRLPYNMVTPSSIYVKHQSGLKVGTKMSKSDPDSAIFLSDSPEAARKKIMRGFTGGRNTADEQRKMGANINVCKVCEFLRYHLPDSKRVIKELNDQKSGKKLCGDLKEFTADFVEKFLVEHQKKKKKELATARKMVFG